MDNDQDCAAHGTARSQARAKLRSSKTRRSFSTFAATLTALALASWLGATPSASGSSRGATGTNDTAAAIGARPDANPHPSVRRRHVPDDVCHELPPIAVAPADAPSSPPSPIAACAPTAGGAR